MPRRRSSAVRADLRFHPLHAGQRLSVIDGLSRRALADVHRWELDRGTPGMVTFDLAHWRREVRLKCGRSWRGYVPTYGDTTCGCGCCEYESGGARGRWGLEHVLAALPRASRRELATVVGAIDARLLAATYGGPPDSPGWWERRL